MRLENRGEAVVHDHSNIHRERETMDLPIKKTYMLLEVNHFFKFTYRKGLGEYIALNHVALDLF